VGWSYPHHTRQRRQLIEELTREDVQETEGRRTRRKVLRHCCVGNVLWTLIHVVDADTGEEVRPAFIACDLMQKHGTWGYKDMTEMDGPLYFTCPESYVAEAGPPRNDYAAKWREHNAAAAEQRRIERAERKSLAVGRTS
jgi:hypothetical protein